MPGSKERWSGKDLREYVKQNIPGAIVITRKPTNHYAMVIDEKTGRILYWAEKNFSLMEQLTSPKESEKEEETIRPLFNIPPQVDINNLSENLAINVLSYLIELTELMGGRKCTLKYDDGSFPTKIVCGPIEFTFGGRKIKGE